MRSINTLIFTLLISVLCQAQDDEAILVDGRLPIDSIYSNKNELIIHSGIHIFENLKSNELKNKVKNWASLNFVNLKEVLVSETDDQMVLNYISSALYLKSIFGKASIYWYIRLLIQFKDGKIRCTYYDDGNVQILPSQYSAGVSARTNHLKDYFKEVDGRQVCSKPFTAGIINLNKSILNNFQSIKIGIEISHEAKKEDW